MSAEAPAFNISPHAYDAVIFDLDGVITRTAKTHAAAWKKLFDEVLKRRATSEGTLFKPFDVDNDYRRYVDGKTRYEGVKSFLESRGIKISYGSPADAAGQETVCGLGNRKNQLFLEQLRKHGVEIHHSTLDLIRVLRANGIKTAVVSSSKNCPAILAAAHIANLFDTKLDGVDADSLDLAGKPAPDTFLEAAKRLGVQPARALIIEDAIVGVQAGRRGKFGCVIGVGRSGQATALKENGADVVVSDLSQVTVGDERSTVHPAPS